MEAKGAYHKNAKTQAGIASALPHWAERARKVLDKCALFGAWNEQMRRDGAAHALSRTFATNEPIFHVGEPGYSIEEPY